MKKKETKFVQSCMKKLHEIENAWFTRIEQTAIRGTPDVIGCVCGNFIGLEFKASKKSPVSKIQEYTLASIIDSLGYGIVVYPENFEEIYTLLINLSKGVKYGKYQSSSNAVESKSNA